MYKGATVKINCELVEKRMAQKGMTQGRFSETCGHSKNWWCGVKREGGMVSPYKAKLISSVLGIEEDALIVKEPAETPQESKKDGTVDEYIALISDSLIEMAKNQAQVSELMTLTSRQSIDNARYNAETGRLFEMLFKQVNDIAKKVDEIHRELK